MTFNVEYIRRQVARVRQSSVAIYFDYRRAELYAETLIAIRDGHDSPAALATAALELESE